MIYTSYYSNKALRSVVGGFRLIGISQRIPKWFTGEVFKTLAPSWTMIHMNNIDDYVRLYTSQILARLNPHEPVNKLDNAILLCWERPEKFCHRRLVAEWLEQTTGHEVPEFICPPMKPQFSVQQSKQLEFDFETTYTFLFFVDGLLGTIW